ncbi:MAG: ExeM/NucH family extracellular endonuclease [Flavobacteriales bacterium]|nr:ExeM/NucH family extracellular endonuclease [Flavobacteriales bacterium]
MRSLTALILGHLCASACAQTPICTIQGSSASSSYAGQTVTTTGVVTAMFQGSGSLQGFFLEDPDCDGLVSTSNGIFVYAPGISGVAVGDALQLNGQVTEYQGLTELINVGGLVHLGTASVEPTEITLPIASASQWERYEGMLLRFPQELVVTDNNDWISYGELTLSPGRLMQPTQTLDPNDAVASGTSSTGSGNASAITAAASVNARSTVLLDDGRTTSYPDPPPLMGAEGTLRCGSNVTGLTGALHYAYGSYRLQPVGAVPLVHELRPAVPAVAGDVTVASLNVLNYFTTLSGDGASTTAELQRQRTKLVATLSAIDADALVLCEVETGTAAWNDLLTGLNATMGAGTYVGLAQGSGAFTQSVLFYKPSRLTPVTQLYALYTSTFQRAHLTQGFEVVGSDARFLLSSMHLRSKSCDGATGANTDQGDGQSCYNALRRQQVQELVSHWAAVRTSSGISAQLVMGDYNAYSEEDPLDLMRANGFVSRSDDGAEGHSYRYLGAFGALDHALCTAAMDDAVLNATHWNINSDEPPQLDYHQDNIAFYQPGPYRCSDHDPVIVGLSSSALVVGVGELTAPGAGVTCTIDGRGVMVWSAAEPFELRLIDALGRVAHVEPSLTNSIAIEEGVLQPGSYVWVCMGSRGQRLGSGRCMLR